MDQPCILFALSRESSAFRRRCRPGPRFAGGPCRARFWTGPGGEILLLETGIGRARTEAALSWLFDRPLFRGIAYRPRFVLSAGFSGALQEGLDVGDAVWATEMVDPDGTVWPATWRPEGRPGLGRCGRLLTSSCLVSNFQEKRKLGREHAALAVDMETAVAARLCSRHGVPFGCVRAISDDVHTSLSPRLTAFLSTGRVSPVRALAALVIEPGLVGAFWRLARQTRTAARQLARALEAVLSPL